MDETLGRKISVEVDGSLVDAVDGRYNELKERELEERLNFLEDLLIERSSKEKELIDTNLILEDLGEEMEGCVIQGDKRNKCESCEYEVFVCKSWKKVVNELKNEIKKLKSQSGW